jgi:hypothetical protein
MADKQNQKQPKPRGKGRPFLPGQSGNPKGRPPKVVSITSIVKRLLEQPCPHDSTKTWSEAIAGVWLEQCYRGNPQLTKELIDRLEGRVPLPVEGSINMHHDISFSVGKGYQ